MKTAPNLTCPLTRAAQDMTQTQIEPMDAPPVAGRTLKHRRSFCYEVYEREDGLWDVEAQMQDRKAYPFTIASGLLDTAEPLHSMILRVTVDGLFNIVDVRVNTVAAPYLVQCQTIIPDYSKMIGLNLVRGFRQAMRERFAGTAGCTHITELASSLPTVAIQGMGVELAARYRDSVGEHNAGRPLQLDRCHALTEGAEAVRLYYPRWYKAPNQS